VEPRQKLLSCEVGQAKLGMCELGLLVALLRHRDRAVSHKQLSGQIWGLN
jgi:DNA-binding winged helix-turn-helix (wHTH) protein